MPVAKKYSLTIRTEPADAHVEFLNGSLTYRPGMEIDPGTYEMRVSRKGYLPRRYDAVVDGRDLVAEVRLQEEQPGTSVPPASGYSLTIRTDPADATVTFMDSGVQYRPGMKLKTGAYEVEVSKDGYSPRRQHIRITDRDVVAHVALPLLYSLTIRPEPADADVEFLNSSLEYLPGMDLEPGTYRMRVSRNGYLPMDYNATLKNGDLVADVRLEEEPSTPAPLPSEYSLSIRTDPADATVTFTDSGVQYRPGVKLAAGSYEIEVSKDGFSSKRQQVRITDRDVVTDVRLTPLYALTIRPTPDDALVRILNIKPKYRDGIEVEPGQYKIEVSKSGYKTFLGMVDVVDQDAIATVELEKEPTPIAVSAPVSPQPTPAPVVPARSASPSKGDTWRHPVTGMEFVWVPGGCYQMGSNDGDGDERPVHEVCVDGFWMGKYEVTQAEWQRVMGNNPSRFKGARNPVEHVSWNDAQELIRKFYDGGNGRCRLPTGAG